jgi:DNA-binding LacI/PurR family transcriptional regulator
MPRNLIDKSDPTPRYLQVRRILEGDVRSGKYRPGDQLPGERDLARALNVSQMTVNKAILAMTADGWLRREIGKGTFVPEAFRPPVPAVLRIGFAVRTPTETVQEDFYLSGLLRGIQRAIANEPVSLNVLEVPKGEIFDRLQEAPIDGCLLVDVLDRNCDDITRLAEAGKRMVIMGVDQEPLPVPFVDSDNYGGAMAAMEHLIGLGHRRIAGVFAYTNSCNSRMRMHAYADALASAGIAICPEYRVAVDDSEDNLAVIHQRVSDLLRASDRPTALFCGGFHLALEAMKAAQEAGLTVPRDISVVGFDDPISARYVHPPLTTVHQPLEEMGYRAMCMLVEWLRTHEEPQHRDVLPATLQVRASTAPANGAIN